MKLKPILETVNESNEEYKIVFYYSDKYMRSKTVKGAFKAAKYFAEMESKWHWAQIGRSPNRGKLIRITMEYEGKTVKSSTREEARMNKMSGANDRYLKPNGGGAAGLDPSTLVHEVKVFRNGMGEVEATVTGFANALNKAMSIFQKEEQEQGTGIDVIVISREGQIVKKMTESDYLFERNRRRQSEQAKAANAARAATKNQQAKIYTLFLYYDDGSRKYKNLNDEAEAIQYMAKVEKNWNLPAINKNDRGGTLSHAVLKHGEKVIKIANNGQAKLEAFSAQPSKYEVIFYYSDKSRKHKAFTDMVAAHTYFAKIEKNWDLPIVNKTAKGGILSRIVLEKDGKVIKTSDKEQAKRNMQSRNITSNAPLEINVFSNGGGGVVDTADSMNDAVNKAYAIFKRSISTISDEEDDRIESIQITQSGKVLKEITEVDYLNHRNR